MIRLTQIYKIYNQGKPNEKYALEDINLHIISGELVAIMGKSGSGKSTLLKLIGGLMPATKGSIVISGQELSTYSEKQMASFRNTELGIVTQNPNLISELSALENTAIPCYIAGSKCAIAEASSALESVGIENIHQKVATLSGGEAERVAIARAIVRKPKLLLADEPTGNLDTANSKLIMTILKNLQKTGVTIVIVTHDDDVAAECDRIIRLKDGKIEIID